MAEEDCWGDDPLVVSPRPVLTAVRFTGESLAHTQESVTSDEIRSDSQITDLVRVAVGAEGDVNFELSYRTFDRFFEGLMRADWDAEVDVNNGTGSPQTGTVTIASPLNVISIAGSPNPFLNVQVGAFIRVQGSATSPSNNGFYEVTANAGGVLTTSPSFAAPESGTNLRVQAGHIRNGTTKKSYLMEKRFTDLSPQQSLYFTGMRTGQGDVSVVPGEILTGTLSFLGKRGFAQDGPLSDVAGITENAAPAFDVANAVDNVSDLLLDGVAIDADLTQLTFSVNNNTRDKPAVSVLGNIDIGLGRFNVEGNITAYFSNRTLYDKYLAFTAHSWSFAVDVDGNAYLFEFPSIKFSNGVILAEGNDGDVVANMDFTARRDPTKGYTLGLNRFSADVGAEFT
jgi:hypothetical protein